MSGHGDQWTRTVRLHGEMAELFGAEFQLAVETPAEAARALQANCPGFYQYLAEAQARGVGFAVVLSDPRREHEFTLSADQLKHPIGAKTLEFVPVPLGSGDNGGILQIILGVVIIIAAVVSFQYYGVAAGTALMAGGLGASLVLGGVAQMLSAPPNIGFDDEQKAEDAESRPSYAFGGPINTAAEGRPVPIGYGMLLVGSHVISAGIQNTQIA